MSDRRPPASPGPRAFGGLGAPVEKPNDAKASLRRLVNLLAPHRFSLLGIFLLSFLGSVFSVSGPKLLGDATTLLVEGLGRGRIDFGALGKLLALVSALYLTSALFLWGQQWLTAIVSQQVVTRLR